MGNELVKEKENYYKKSNFLISVKTDSSLLENKIMAIALNKIMDVQFDKQTKKIYSRLKAADIRALLNGNGGSFYEQLEETAKLMTGRVIGAKDPEEKTFTYISVITMADYRDGIFTIEWNDHLRKYLVDIGKDFTLLNLNLMTKFKSTWSFRLYEILRSKSFNHKNEDQNNTHFEFEYYLSELRFELGSANANLPSVRRYLDKRKVEEEDFDNALKIAIKAGECSYVEWRNFKRKVLDIAVNEINNNPLSEIHIQYIPVKSGKGGKIRSIKFITDIKREEEKKENIIENIDELNEISEDDVFDEAWEVLSKDFKAKEVRVLIREAKYDVEKIRKAYDILKKKRTDTDNKMGFMISAIKEEYDSPEKKFGKASQNDFIERSYTQAEFANLEEILLNKNKTGD